MDKVTLDFEKETVTWESDTQNGTEYSPGLANRKNDILAAMGYEIWDASNVLNAVGDFIDCRIDEDSFAQILEEEKEK